MADTLRNTNTLNDVPSGERVHIGFFGIRNAGKSSVVNAVTNQELALVSEVRGTTTDPVLKAMELLPIGPVVIIDTPGIDDEGELGAMRVERTRQALRQTDVAVLVADSTVGLQEADRELLDLFAEKKTPCVVARLCGRGLFCWGERGTEKANRRRACPLNREDRVLSGLCCCFAAVF